MARLHERFDHSKTPVIHADGLKPPTRAEMRLLNTLMLTEPDTSDIPEQTPAQVRQMKRGLPQTRRSRSA